MELKKENRPYTYHDYLSLDESSIFEIIDGERIDISMAAPSSRHQQLVSFLHYKFTDHFKTKNCVVRQAPMDVVLGSEHDINNSKNVVQPDIFVVCKNSKGRITEKCCEGPPALIAEIVSPSSIKLDYIKKAYIYEYFGVLEYWIVDPINDIVKVLNYSTNSPEGFEKIYNLKSIVGSFIFPDLEVDFSESEIY